MAELEARSSFADERELRLFDLDEISFRSRRESALGAVFPDRE